ncbi:hypothetical protein, partial [Falsiroseomonas selenitidurans]
MATLRTALLAMLLLGPGAAGAQSSLAPTQGSLPPPRPTSAPRLVPAEQPRNLAAPPPRAAA